MYDHMEQLYKIAIALKARIRRLEKGKSSVQNRRLKHQIHLMREVIRRANENGAGITASAKQLTNFARRRAMGEKDQICHGMAPGLSTPRSTRVTAKTTKDDLGGRTVWIHFSPRPSVGDRGTTTLPRTRSNTGPVPPPKPRRHTNLN